MRLSSSTTHLSALVQAQLSSVREAARQERPAIEARKPGKASSRDIASLAAQRIHLISRDDPQRRSKAMRIYLESVLLSQFGSSLLQDPQFSSMVDHVQSQLASTPELQAALAQAADTLLEAAS